MGWCRWLAILGDRSSDLGDAQASGAPERSTPAGQQGTARREVGDLVLPPLAVEADQCPPDGRTWWPVPIE
jgi:hypothetical protein